jgi:hypothetical protein
MVVHLIDGTYELFRHFYRRRRGGPDAPVLEDAEQMRWHGPTPEFGDWAVRLGDDRLRAR